ncbi:hypothetical protein [Persicitalea sp.]|uniref:TapB family protein n=1 Tax=Persicitalea sp. TaxID=3100273 RepID=UPI003593DDD0
MKKLLAFAILLFTLSPLALRAQECMGVSLKQGSGYELLSYDAKGKENGRMIYKVKKVSKDGPDTVIEMDLETFDKKDKSQMTNTFTMRCNGNEMHLDASSMMPQGQGKQFESFDMTFTSKDIIYPANLSVGQTLPDGSLHGEGAAGPMSMTMDTEFVNRKVEGREKITVPAGTFDTFKITSDMNINMKSVMKMNMEFSTVSYRSPKILWDVKTENYRKGKLMGTTVLSKIL